MKGGIQLSLLAPTKGGEIAPNSYERGGYRSKHLQKKGVIQLSLLAPTKEGRLLLAHPKGAEIQLSLLAPTKWGRLLQAPTKGGDTNFTPRTNNNGGDRSYHYERRESYNYRS